ncbi:MAG: hypothetical protein A2902_00015 [Elusimicrobia bacterium RIFCSPLOWO2_01_FULL_64_13]|nr:MAG: hypothetical protein A2636_00540 [Elusimicrobia bacterium RIFCSPHIGHO2_01_FULL_64_10]OGR97967.1 MAG: hypothetical protein A2902_00015 [Elusimicrobia bacterium RIFCSPLOWO2_01_FULL_64_13]
MRARNADSVVTSFSADVTTFTSVSEVVQSTGGVVDAGQTTITADVGVTITNTTLADGTVQQTLSSTGTKTVTYGSGISLELPAGVVATVVATADSVRLTSTGTVPMTESGVTIEATSGTLTIQSSIDTLTVSLATDAPQNVVTAIPTTSAKTVAITLNPPSGAIKTSIPPGALLEQVRVRVKLPDSFPTVTAAGSFAPAVGDLQRAYAGAPYAAGSILAAKGIGLEITLDKNIQPSKAVSITVTYRDSDISGSNPENLVVARFDETIQKWVTLPTSINAAGRSATGTTKHFSKFQLMAVTAATDVDAAKVYPNPLRRHRGNTDMTFSNLTAHASVRIFTYLGEKVAELQADATGTARWDGKTQFGKDAASGIYVAVIEGAGGRKILKLAVEK